MYRSSNLLGLRTTGRRLLRSIRGLNSTVEAAIRPPIGQISINESRYLGQLVTGLTATGPIIEIGTLFGWSTRIIALFKSPDRELITVDNFAWNPLGISRSTHRRIACRVIEEDLKDHNVRLVEQDKSQFYHSYQGAAPSLVFLDAIHTYEETQADIAWARQVGAKIICLHDYRPDFPGVIRATDEAGGVQEKVESLVILNISAS